MNRVDSEYLEAMTERRQRLQDALERAEAGKATSEDWAVIRYECGMPKPNRSTS